MRCARAWLTPETTPATAAGPQFPLLSKRLVGINGGGKETGNQLSRRGEAKSRVRLRNLAIRSVYAGLRFTPPCRDCALQVSSEFPLLVNDGNGLSIPHVAEVPFLPATGQQPGTKSGHTFPALITNASVDDSTGAIFAELQSKLL